MTHPDNSELPTVVVFAIDGLRSSAIGAYGNTICATPFLDQLATESILFDQFRCSSPSLASNYSALLEGMHPLANEGETPLPKLIAQQGGSSVFFTDDPNVLGLPLVSQFDRAVHCQIETPKAPVESAADAVFAEFLEQLLKETLELPPGSLLWVHSSGLYGPWDAPMNYREALRVPDDPPAMSITAPPVEAVNQALENDDPSELEDLKLGIHQAYCAQTVLFDQLLDIFFEQASAILDEAHVLLFGTRGYPLGEHNVIGKSDSLYFENIHVPLLFRRAPRAESAIPQPERSRTLTQFTDVYDLLAAAFIDNLEQQLSLKTNLIGTDANEFCVLTNGQQHAFITQAWKAIVKIESDSTSSPLLFVKPDDRWDANNVSSRCRHIVNQCYDLLETQLQWLETHSRTNPVKLPNELSSPLA